MVMLTRLFASVLLLSATCLAAPIEKRIAQTIADSTTAWVAACTKAGGADKCQPISQVAFTSLLAAGKNCDQQDAADSMIDLAKTLSSDAEMIRLAQIFVQQPRNAPDSLQVPYCQTAPKNTELSGLFHCEFAGSDFTKFSGDQTGNVPLGLTAVSPSGSCPANTAGPIADGVQLETLVTDPGTPSSGSGSSSGNNSSSVVGAPSSVPAPASSTSVASPAASSPASSCGGSTSGTNTTGSTPGTGTAGDPGSSSNSSSSDSTSSTSGFTLQNGQDAQKLNAQFASLTASSTCTEGEQACVSGGFAQCVAGEFVVTQCAGGTQCFALPLVNKAGTSIACTTQDDATSRIAATGATGGVTGA